MSRNQFYELPFVETRSAFSITKPKKRKRKKDDDDENDSIASSEEDLQREPSQSTWAELLPEDARQRKAAGLSANEDIPGNHFPHRPQDYKPYTGTYAAPSQVQKALASLNPPLIDHSQRNQEFQASRSSLKQQHLNAMYTLVHKCLLEQDFIRAERAFGLLMRTESLGKLPDLRNKNLWGIGAEILLQRGAQARKLRGEIPETRQTIFDRKGIEDVREYYEKLIIQFPHRHSKPDAVSSFHMYPVLFGFWIASIDDKYHAAMQSVRGESIGSTDDHTTEQTEDMESIRTSVLTSAQEVARRLDDVLQSIPHSDDPVLWNLRGHMYLWIDDLSKSHQESHPRSDSSSEDPVNLDGFASAQTNARRAFEMARIREAERGRQSQPVEVDQSDEP